MAERNEASPLHIELMAERASAYFATTRKMEAALTALVAFDRAASLEPTPEQQRTRQGLLADAAEQVWNFAIQREAMKLPLYDELFADFGVSDEVRRCMGPKRSSLPA
jgi:hypothetical protein